LHNLIDVFVETSNKQMKVCYFQKNAKRSQTSSAIDIFCIFKLQQKNWWKIQLKFRVGERWFLCCSW